MDSTKKLCALYCRISTDKQDNTSQIESLTSQALRDGFLEENISVYEEVLSGFKNRKDRPKLNELLNIVESNPHQFAIIYVQELSRISRSPREISDIFYKFSELKQQVYIKSNNLFLLDENGERSLVAGILISILAELGREEARVFKERSSRGLLTSARSGKAGGGASLAYGYTKDENKMLAIDDNEALIIKEIFQMKLDGYGGKMIANVLNNKGYKTRFAKTHGDTMIKFKGMHKKGSEVHFSEVVVSAILRNSLYCGQRKFKGEILQAPAIISVEYFNKVQELLKVRKREGLTATHPYLLKNIDMKCGVCGRNYFGRYKSVKGGDCIYVCSSKFTHEGSCGNPSVNIDFIENVLLNLVKNSGNFKDAAKNTEAIREKILASVRKVESQLILNKRSLKSKEAESKKLLNMHLADIITFVVLKERTEKIKQDILSLQASISYFNQELSSYNVQLKRVEKPVTIKHLEKMKNDRTFLTKYFEGQFSKLIFNGINKKEILVKLQSIGMDDDDLFYLLLDKTALLSRYPSTQLNYKMYSFGMENKKSPNYPKYKNNILLSDAKKIANHIHNETRFTVFTHYVIKEDMISIKSI